MKGGGGGLASCLWMWLQDGVEMVVGDVSNGMGSGEVMLKEHLKSRGLEDLQLIDVFLWKESCYENDRYGRDRTFCTLDEKRCFDRDGAIEKFACEMS